jgi:RNA polymerase-binding protein DksA
MRSRLDDRVSGVRLEASLSTGGESAGGLSNVPIHPADLGNQEAEADVSIALAENEAYLRQEIDDALARIDAGTFGICEECHRSIPEGRLQAAPYSRLCIECANRLEQHEQLE